MSENQLLGGQRALLGFYYQLLASIGIPSELAISRIDEADPFQLLTQFDMRDAARFLPEGLGQDLILESGARAVLVQLKHSATPTSHTVGLPDIRDVVLKFAESLVHAGERGLPSSRIDACILITNRPIGGDAIKVVEWARKCRSLCGIPEARLGSGNVDPIKYCSEIVRLDGKDDTIESFLATWVKQRPKAVVDDEEIINGSKSAKSISKKQAADSALVEALIHVLPRLYVLEEVPMRRFHVAFEQLGKQYGALPDEIQSAQDLLIHKMIVASIGVPTSFSQADFAKAFTHSREARRMTPEELGPPCAQSLQSWVQEYEASVPWHVHRDLGELRDKIAGKRIIIIAGDGGCGKTEALAEILLELAGSFASFSGFAAIRYARRFDDQWLDEELSRWAARTVTNKTAVRRLEIANPNSDRLLWIGIDGLDEFPTCGSALYRLCEAIINKETDNVRVLATCRRTETRQMIRQCIRDSPSMSANGETRDIGIVNLGGFESSELADALEAGLGERCDDLLDINPSLAPMAAHAPTPPIQSASIYLTSLAHPRMLGSFLKLYRKKEDLRLFLDGDANVLRSVALMFLREFFRKYESRQLSVHGFRLEDHVSVYQAIAASTRDSDRNWTIRDWILVAKSSENAESVNARWLFNEAASGGLITDEGQNHEWEWQHQFVLNCLSEEPTGAFLP